MTEAANNSKKIAIAARGAIEPKSPPIRYAEASTTITIIVRSFVAEVKIDLSSGF